MEESHDDNLVKVIVSHDVTRFAHLVETQLDLTITESSTTTRHVTVVGPNARKKITDFAKSQVPPGYVTVLK